MKRWTLLTSLFLVMVGTAVAAADVWVLEVHGEIGRGMVSYLRKGLVEAEAAGAAAVVIEFATPGGYLDAAVAGRDAVLDATLPTIAYVNREAYSAGALLAIACERIFYAPGGVIGAATPVTFDGARMLEAPEKLISAMRTLFRSTAEARGRPPVVAEAMVDRDVAIEDLVAEGKLLTLTASDAAFWGYSDGEAETVDVLAAGVGLADAAVVRYGPRTLDAVVDTLTLPWLAAALITIGLLGLIVEMLIPGFGIPGIVGLLCLGAFFWSHFLVGLAGWESLAFLVGGAVAIVLEVFVFTAVDFGFSGLIGLILIGLGFYTAMVGPFTAQEQAVQAVGIVAGGVVLSLVVAIVLLTKLPRTRLRLGGIILSSVVTGRSFDRAEATPAPTAWLGQRGVAVTDLRPVGSAEFSGLRTDVVCEEGYLEKGTDVVIIKDQEYRKVVRRASSFEEGSA